MQRQVCSFAMSNLSIHLLELGSPRSSSGYGSSEEEQNALFSRGNTFGLSGQTSGLLTPTSANGSDGSCPVTPDSAIFEVNFPSSEIDFLENDPLGFVRDSDFLTGVGLGSYSSPDAEWDYLRPPFFDDSSALDFDLGDSRGLEACCNEDENNIDGAFIEATSFLCKTRLASPTIPDSSLDNKVRSVSDTDTRNTDTGNGTRVTAKILSDSGFQVIKNTNNSENGNTEIFVADVEGLAGNRNQQTTLNSVNKTTSELASANLCLPWTDFVVQKQPSDASFNPVTISSESIKILTQSRFKSCKNKQQPYVTSASVTSSSSNALAPVSTSNHGNVASTSSTTSFSGNRRTFSQLEDHRYSSSSRPIEPPSKVSKISRTAQTTTSADKTTILEFLLLTKEPLKANAGSDAMFALSGLNNNNNNIQRDERKFQTRKSVLEGLLTETNNYRARKEPKVLRTGVVQTSNQISNNVPYDITTGYSENYELFSDHLLRDSNGIQVGLQTVDDINDQSWVPSRMDDRVFSSEVEDIFKQDLPTDDLWVHQYLSDLL